MIGILQWKPYNRAWGARKCTPIPACGGTSPGGGSTAARVAKELDS